MSGGHFSYQQYHIGEIADSIEGELKRQGNLKPKEELYNRREFYDDYPEEKHYYTYPKEVQAKMRAAIKALRIAAVYAQRVDWLLSGDDGEENFLSRLGEDLKKLSKK